MEESLPKTSAQTIAELYERFRRLVYSYIYNRIGRHEEAEDLMQDTFVRLMDYAPMLRTETAKSFIFSIAHNLVIDHARRRAKWQEISTYIYDVTTPCTCDDESRLVANDLLRAERSRIRILPPQRRKVYVLSRFAEQSAEEIADRMGLSRRTVENHLFISRKEIRGYLRKVM